MKVWRAVQSGSFCSKLRYFTDQNDKSRCHMKMNFDYFQKWMLQIVRMEKVDEKNELICLVFMFFSWVVVFHLSKKVNLLQFCADISKKASIKAIYIFNIKVLTTLFQKIIWFVRVWAIIHEKLVNKISKQMLFQLEFHKIIWLRTLMSPKN